MRNLVVTSCLLLSALLGTAAILSHRFALQGVVLYVGFVWTFSDMVINGVFSRSYWRARNIPISQLYKDAKQGKAIHLPQQRGAIGRVTRVGSSILMLIFMALYFI